MVLDAPTFKLVLTPEAALGIVQKEVQHRGWKKFEVEEIRLIYSPYYVFSFDVRSENGPPVTGKTAMNAYSGEISDFVPMVMDRPLNKTKTPEEGGEVEETTISISEAKQVSRDKIAAQAGIKPEMVTTSAFSKVYVPFYRVWMEVGHNSMKVDVDALMGAPLGIEGAPEREKTWGEATNETLSKLKSPSGWIELTGKAISSVTGGGGGGHGDAHGGGDHGGGDGHGGGGHAPAGGGPKMTTIIFGGAILILVYLMFFQSNTGMKCTGNISDFENKCILEGQCEITVKKADQILGNSAYIFIKEDGKENISLNQSSILFQDKTIEPYTVVFDPGFKECSQFGWGYRKA